MTSKRESGSASVDAPRVGSAELDALMHDHADTVYRMAMGIVRDPALADDVLQETLIRAWRSGPLDDDGRVPRAWLLKVARNVAISMLRSRREVVVGPESLPEHETLGVSRTVEGRHALADLWRALSVLNEDDRTLVVLREMDGLSYDELSELLGMPLATVKTRLFRARRTLQKSMEEWR